MRDMAKKPPTASANFAPLNITTQPSAATGAPPLMRTFPVPARSRLQEEPRNAFIIDTPVAPPVPSNVVRTFENNSRIKPRSTKPKTQPEPWAPLSMVLKKSEQAQIQQQVKQLDRPVNPDVTVLIDVKNDITFLDAFLQSLVRQTYTNWVATIGLRSEDDDLKSKINDAVLKLQMGNLVEIIELANTLTETESFNASSKNANTPYVALARRTDLWVSRKLEKQLAAVKNTPEVGVVGTMSRLFGDRVELVNIPPGKLNIDDFSLNNPVVFSSVLMKKELLHFSDEFTSYDYESWVRLNRKGVAITNLSDILTLQRVGDSVSKRKEDRDEVKSKYGL